jgi:hypothetical protein
MTLLTPKEKLRVFVFVELLSICIAGRITIRIAREAFRFCIP